MLLQRVFPSTDYSSLVLELRKKSVRALLEKFGRAAPDAQPAQKHSVAQERCNVVRLLQGRAISHYLDLSSLVNDLSND